MSAARHHRVINADSSPTACPPRRPFVVSDDRHRGQACASDIGKVIDIGPTATTVFDNINNVQRFTLIVDDCATIHPSLMRLLNRPPSR